jgi:hypothetical protein
MLARRPAAVMFAVPSLGSGLGAHLEVGSLLDLDAIVAPWIARSP